MITEVMTDEQLAELSSVENKINRLTNELNAKEIAYNKILQEKDKNHKKEIEENNKQHEKEIEEKNKRIQELESILKT